MDNNELNNIKKALELFASYLKFQAYDDQINNLIDAVSMFSNALLSIDNANDKRVFFEEFARLIELSKELTEFQRIMLSKQIPLSYLDLSKEEKVLRDKVTKNISILLLKSFKTSFDYETNVFNFDGEKISYAKLVAATQISSGFKDITTDEILEFTQHLYKYPYLALNHPVGQKILSESSNFEQSYIYKIRKGHKYYRARMLEKNTLPFHEKEMRSAPFKVPGQGRFNTQGVARFYLSTSKEQACKEVIKHTKNRNDIQVSMFEAVNDMDVLDLLRFNVKFAESCLAQIEKNEQFNAEYLCSGYLAQCIEYHGNLCGIRYGSESDTLFMLYNDYGFKHIDYSIENYEKFIDN